MVSFGFSAFGVLFGLAFVAVLAILIIIAVKGLGQWQKNNRSPVLTVQAVVTSKRTNVSHHMQQMGEVSVPMTDTTYYVTFEVQSGSRLEFHMPGRDYGQLREGDHGALTFQGTRYLDFRR